MIFLGHTTDDGRIVPEFPAQQHAYVRRHFPAGTCLEYDVRAQRSKRTDRQNRALHCLLQPWAKERGWDPDDLKLKMLEIAFGTIERVEPITNQIVRVAAEPHSSRLNVTQFCHLIDEVLRVAAEDDYWLLAPDEYRRAKEAALKASVKRETAA